MRLLAVEVRRITARALVLIAMIGGLAGIAVALVGVAESVRPMDPQQVAQAEAMYEQELERWAEHGEDQVASCLEEQERARADGDDPTLDHGCDAMEPQLEWFIWQAPPLTESLPWAQSSTAYLVLFVSLAVGTTATAAEMSTGAMATLLTFVPRRLRVYGAKLAAPALVMVPVTALLLGAHLLGTWLLHDAADLADGMTSHHWGEAAATLGRTVAASALVAAIGAALGVLARRTAVVLGGAIAYMVAVEGIGSALGLRPWLLALNLDGVINGGTEYWTQVCEITASGTVCEGTAVPHTLTQSVIYLAVVAVVVIGGAALVFRRRDL